MHMYIYIYIDMYIYIYVCIIYIYNIMLYYTVLCTIGDSENRLYRPGVGHDRIVVQLGSAQPRDRCR